MSPWSFVKKKKKSRVALKLFMPIFFRQNFKDNVDVINDSFKLES